MEALKITLCIIVGVALFIWLMVFNTDEIEMLNEKLKDYENETES